MPTIQQALTAVMGDVREVKKSQVNQRHKFSFRGIDDVVNAVGPAMRKHGVVCMPEVLDIQREDRQSTNGGILRFAYVTVRYVLTGPDGDSLSGVVVAESFDSGDKATAKAMSVAYRTFLLQALTLPTDDTDPDHNVAPESGTDFDGMIAQAAQRGRDALIDLGKFGRGAGWPEARLQQIRDALGVMSS